MDPKLKILKCGNTRRGVGCAVCQLSGRVSGCGETQTEPRARVRCTVVGGAVERGPCGGDGPRRGGGGRGWLRLEETRVPHPTALRPVWLWVSELLCSPTRPDRTRPRANRKSATDGREPSRVSTSHDSSRQTRARTPGARDRAAKPEAGSGPHRDGTGSGLGPVCLQLVVWQSLTRFQAAA